MDIYLIQDLGGDKHWTLTLVPGDTLLRTLPFENFVSLAQAQTPASISLISREDIAAVLDEVCRQYDIYPPDLD